MTGALSMSYSTLTKNRHNLIITHIKRETNTQRVHVYVRGRGVVSGAVSIFCSENGFLFVVDISHTNTSISISLLNTIKHFLVRYFLRKDNSSNLGCLRVLHTPNSCDVRIGMHDWCSHSTFQPTHLFSEFLINPFP